MQEQEKKEEGGLGDDPTVALEKEISDALMVRGKEMLAKIVARLDNGCDLVRVFRLLENIAKHHRELIAALHGGDSFRKNAGLGGEEFGAQALYGGISSYGNQEENFGAQALKGLVEGLKKPKDKGGEIDSLTRALNLATLNDNPKMTALADKLQKRLNHLLDDEVIPLGSIDLGDGVEAEVEVADAPKEDGLLRNMDADPLPYPGDGVGCSCGGRIEILADAPGGIGIPVEPGNRRLMECMRCGQKFNKSLAAIVSPPKEEADAQ